MLQRNKAFVCLSGGLDSTTVLAIVGEQHDASDILAVSFNYGQRHAKELEQAAKIAAFFGIKHRVVELPNIPSSMLTEKDATIPSVRYADLTGVSPTYVPFRNGLMLATLAAIASPPVGSMDNAHIYVGMHAEDAANDAYPDCRLDFVGTMGAAIYIGSYHRVRVHAPLIEMSKADVVMRGYELSVPFDLTWSCYKGEEFHCGVCPTCRARKEAFIAADIVDPTHYAA